MTFHIGQKVVCIRGPYQSLNWPGRQDAVVGDVYTVRGITSGTRPQYGVGLLLEEIRNPTGYSGEAGFYSSRFRPLVEPKAETSFTEGAPKDSERWDNCVKKRERVG